mgnify:CR=1 FL=1
MLTIYLTRHGETEWNTQNRLQGWKNSPLTEKGIRGAQLLGKRLSNIDFNVIYASPSERAYKTANYIRSGRDIPVITDENLKELSYGDWEGKTRDELKRKFKKEYNNFSNAPNLYDPKPHNGESLTDIKQRVESVLKRIHAENTNGNILIVTHGVTLKVILACTMNIPIESMWTSPFIHNTSLTVFHWDGESYKFEMVGDTSHLK